MSHTHHEGNRESWNAATRQHNTHKGNQAAFLRSGGNTLFPEETALLGNIRSKQLVHLQCNTGVDSLSIAAHLGADVTGVDISDEAIGFAQTLSQASGINGRFIRADVVDWLQTTDELFDVVFTSYGTTGWLSDLQAWGRGIGNVLKPGGCFVMVEFHPVVGMYDQNMTLMYDYMGGRHIYNEDGVGDYVGGQSGEITNTGTAITDETYWQNTHPSHEFAWGLADHISALMQGGLHLTHVEEYPYCNGWMPFTGMIEQQGRRMYPPEGVPKIPMMFGIRAVKA